MKNVVKHMFIPSEFEASATKGMPWWNACLPSFSSNFGPCPCQEGRAMMRLVDSTFMTLIIDINLKSAIFIQNNVQCGRL